MAGAGADGTGLPPHLEVSGDRGPRDSEDPDHLALWHPPVQTSPRLWGSCSLSILLANSVEAMPLAS
jgi:hypothetical protein